RLNIIVKGLIKLKESHESYLKTLLPVNGISSYLDMVDEANSLLRGARNKEIAGVSEKLEKINDIKITNISILNEQGEKTMGKPIGQYITIELSGIEAHKDVIADASAVVAKILQPLLPQIRQNGILVIGLGNNHATPDSLGPRVVDYTMATRHLFQCNAEICDNLQPLCTLAPGVLGITGIETAEIIKGVVEHVKPDVIIAIDSLASASIKRVGTTIQISDTGINPGSGIGNRRIPINKSTMGIPVIAIGVPTVVNTMVIIYEALTGLLELWKKQGYTNVPPIEQKTLETISGQMLDIFGGTLIVTPKEIDKLIKDVSKIIAAAIAQVAHKKVNKNNYHLYMN
ncbi:MAG: GPR endopeptidase, partial [Bacillota bacterium]